MMLSLYQVQNWPLATQSYNIGNMSSSDYEAIVIRFNPVSLFPCPILGMSRYYWQTMLPSIIERICSLKWWDLPCGRCFATKQSWVDLDFDILKNVWHLHFIVSQGALLSGWFCCANFTKLFVACNFWVQLLISGVPWAFCCSLLILLLSFLLQALNSTRLLMVLHLEL